MTFWDFADSHPYLTTFGGLAALLLLALFVEAWHQRRCVVRAHEATCRAQAAKGNADDDT
jgi:uncharacterized membrane protein